MNFFFFSFYFFTWFLLGEFKGKATAVSYLRKPGRSHTLFTPPRTASLFPSRFVGRWAATQTLRRAGGSSPAQDNEPLWVPWSVDVARTVGCLFRAPQLSTWARSTLLSCFSEQICIPVTPALEESVFCARSFRRLGTPARFWKATVGWSGCCLWPSAAGSREQHPSPVTGFLPSQTPFGVAQCWPDAARPPRFWETFFCGAFRSSPFPDLRVLY